MTAEEWIAAFAVELGLEPPGPEEVDRLLRLASVAAHSSERRAAPIACWLTAAAGLDTEQALAIAERLAPSAE
jgi:hypothetical protein